MCEIRPMSQRFKVLATCSHSLYIAKKNFSIGFGAFLNQYAISECNIEKSEGSNIEVIDEPFDLLAPCEIGGIKKYLYWRIKPEITKSVIPTFTSNGYNEEILYFVYCRCLISDKKYEIE